jgi:sec-independent protein translocase protein TatA
MFEGILQPTHLVLILAIILIIFGPGKLPELGKTLGSSIRELRTASSEPITAEKPAAPVAMAAATTVQSELATLPEANTEVQG